jgi:exosome complex component RRP4
MIPAEKRELVVPGDLIAEGKYRLREGVFREGERVYSSVVGLAELRGDVVRVIPLRGRYVPRVGDTVIGIVVDTHYSGWIVEINSPYTGNLLVSDFLGRKVDLFREDTSKYLNIKDVVALRVKEVDERMQTMLEAGRSGLGKIRGGKLVDISPAKIPRVLGKKGSMLEVLQRVGGCRLLVGRNGRIMVWGRDERMVDVVVEALFTIEREAHTSGLTDRIRLMLEKAKSEVK